MLDHPEVAYRTCEECCRWFYDSKTGIRSERFGEPLPRDDGSKPSCLACPKVTRLPADRRNPKEGEKQTLSAKNWRTLILYYEHRAARKIVRDPLTAQNFGVIERILDEHDRGQRKAILTLAAMSRR